MHHKVNTRIASVEYGSPAYDAGIAPGDSLVKINGHRFYDVLEYRYLSSDSVLELEVEKADGSIEMITVDTDYEELGIVFENELIDDAKSCTNKCIFCFIDQLPQGMRDAVYFKDDDTRLSFLQGNYVTLTNMTDEDIDRMIAMHISPVNISVHATDPELRKKMLNNRFAGKLFDIMKKFAAHRIYMNCQIVLCPGINDGKQLDRTISDLESLWPYVLSVSVVPVGLTAYREGLYPLRLYTPDECADIISRINAHQKRLLKKTGSRLIYAADEFYVNSGQAVPAPEEYEGYPQLENGVGLIASMEEEFSAALFHLPQKIPKRRASIATGELAAGFIRSLAARLKEAAGVEICVYPIKNEFFGGGVNVAGLVTGGDLIRQLRGKELSGELFIPAVMLRGDDGIFLDDVTVEQVEKALGVKITAVYNDGYDFVEKLTGCELEF